MKNQTILGSIIAVGIGATIAGGLYFRQQPAPTDNNLTSTTLRVNTATQLESLDSTKYSTSIAGSTISNLIDGLYGPNATGKTIPVISNGHPTISKDKKVYTFTLRHFTWSNGSPVTADDFVYAWQRLADPKTNSRNASNIDLLVNGAAVRKGTKPVSALGVKALGKYKLRVSLIAATPVLDEILSQTSFMPINRAYATKQGTRYGTTSTRILTCGPFRITGWSGEKDNRWAFIRNPTYAAQTRVTLEQIQFSVAKDNQVAATKLEKGQLDYTAISSDTIPKYTGHQRLKRMSTTTGAYLFFNVKDSVTGNVHLRRAIATAFDKHLLTTGKLGNGSVSLNGLIPAGLNSSPSGTDFRAKNGDLLPYDASYARSEWQKAKQSLKKSSLTVTLNIADTDEAKLVGQFLKGQLEHNLPGLSVKVVSTTLAKRVALESAGKYQIAFATWSPSTSDPYGLLSFNQTDSPLNISGFSDATYDKMLTTITNELGVADKKRWRTTLEAEKYVMTQKVPTVGVYQSGLAYLLSDRVAQFPILKTGVINYEYVRMK